MVFQYILWGKINNSAKNDQFSEVMGNYTYNQGWCLMIASQSTNIVFKLLTDSYC